MAAHQALKPDAERHEGPGPRRGRHSTYLTITNFIEQKTGSRFLTVAGAHYIQTLLERDTVVREVLRFFDEHGHG